MNKPYAFGKQRSAVAPRRAMQPRFDVATFVDIGARTSQQDAVLANFPHGEEIGIGILADGMGGHLGGEIASHLALSAAFAETKLQMVNFRAGKILVPQALEMAVERANTAVADYVASAPALSGMGTTLVILVAAGPDLYWASVGDSPLYLYRDGALKRLNEDHSMVPQIEAMVASGMIDPKQAAAHPQRNQLVSAICGSKVAHVDCPKEPFRMKAGDILILASDGIQTLSDDDMARLIRKKRRAGSDEIGPALVQAVIGAEEVEQDNTSVLVMKLLSDDAIAMLPKSDAMDMGPGEKSVAAKFPDDPDVEQASDLLNQALLL